MKKITYFILGLLIGVGLAFGFNYAVRTYTIRKHEMTYHSQSGDKTSALEKAKAERDRLINTQHHNDNCVQSADEISFPLPSEEMLSFADGKAESFIYDFQDDGRGVLICTSPVGMQKLNAKIFVTPDRGETWEAVQNEYSFANSGIQVLCFGDTITVINGSAVTSETVIHTSTDGGKTFTAQPFIYYADDEYQTFYATPLIISKDREKNSALIAWCDPVSEEVLTVCEHNGTTFSIMREFFRNDTAIEKLTKRYHD